MQSDYKRRFLNLPGPSPVPRRVLAAMNRQSVDFGRADFEESTLGILSDLKKLCHSEDGHAFVYSANGHGAWEAAIANVLSPGDVVLVPENGQFSNGWATLAKELGVVCELLEGDWESGVTADRIEKRLRSDTSHEIKAVLQVQTDTGSSIAADILQIREAIDAAGHPALLFVDAVASLGASELRQSDWGVDVVVSASQKALMLPPGLAILSVNEKALTAAKLNTNPRSYWDWENRQIQHSYKRFGGTPPEQMLFGLREVLDMLFEEGLKCVWARHRFNASLVHQAVSVWSECGEIGFNVVDPRERSICVTTIRISDALNANQIRKSCADDFDTYIAGGLGRLAGKAIRIGHMGHINAPAVFAVLGSVEATLLRAGAKLKRSGLEAAVTHAATNW